MGNFGAERRGDYCACPLVIYWYRHGYIIDMSTIEYSLAPGYISPEIRVKVRSLDGIISVPVRPLNLQDISAILTTARRSGWYGNLDLIHFIARTCIVASPEIVERATDDIFLNANVSKEVWLLTLRKLAHYTAKLSRGLPGVGTIPKVRRYKSRDLATPGLLYFIRQDLRNIDTTKFAKFVIDTHIVDARAGTKPLSKRQTLGALKKVGHEKAAAWIMEVLGVEPRLFSSPRLRFLNDGERLYATFILATTLDWRQYYDQAHAYNRVLTTLVQQSLHLAGMPQEDASARLLTGIPLFTSLVSPPEELPAEVCAALANAAHIGRLSRLSRKYRPVAREAIAEAKKAARAALDPSEDSRTRSHTMVLALMNSFSKQISSSSGLVLDACIAHHDEFCHYLDAKLREEVGLYQQAVKLSSVPDCYILVEGASDVEYVEVALELLGYSDLNVRIEDCNGKSGVQRRFRDLVKKHSYIGSVAALFDSDAEAECRDLDALLRQSRSLLATRLKNGTIEDCFSRALQVRALNTLYPDGLRLRVGDISNARRREVAIKNALWEKKQAKFEKVALAKEIRRRLKSPDEIPEEIGQFAKRAMRLARQQALMKRHANERFAEPEYSRFFSE
jgi:hypothetical protein